MTCSSSFEQPSRHQRAAIRPTVSKRTDELKKLKRSVFLYPAKTSGPFNIYEINLQTPPKHQAKTTRR